MILFFNLLVFAFIAYWGWHENMKHALRLFYWPAISLKVFSGIALGWIYLNYLNGGDTWSMFAAASAIKSIIDQSPGEFLNIFVRGDYSLLPNFQYTWIPAAFMVKLLALLCFITDSNYWLIAVYLSFFSFFGLWAFAKSLYQLTSDKWVALVPTVLFPSIVFWSSGLLKDSLAVGALGWLFSVVISSYLGRSLSKSSAIIALISFVLLAIVKYYLAAIFLVSVLTLISVLYLEKYSKSRKIQFIIPPVVFTILLLISSLLHPNLWPSRFLEVIYSNYQQYHLTSDPANLIYFKNLGPNITSFLQYSPKALLGGLFMPLWLPELTIFKLGVIVENWFLLLLGLLAIYRLLKQKLVFSPLLYSALLYVITTAIFITFSTPNFGTLVRYKTGYLLLFLPLLLSAVLTRTKKTN